MIPEAVTDALSVAGLERRPIRPASGGLSSDGWVVGDPPVAFAKHRPLQPHRVRPEVAALQHLERNGFGQAPRVLGVSSCWTAFVATAVGGVGLDQLDRAGEARPLASLGRAVATLHELVVDEGSQMKRSTDPLDLGDRVICTATSDLAHAGIDATDSVASAVAWLRERRPANLIDGRFVHRDLRAANVRVIDDEVSGLLDFDRACAGDPAWDWVKVRWWSLGTAKRPDALEEFSRGYAEIGTIPDAGKVRWFAMAEAVGLATRFTGNYRSQARRQIAALLRDDSLPDWEGGAVNFA
jgi:aminoglycoside phosphotransferase (APT) family kinase protein